MAFQRSVQVRITFCETVVIGGMCCRANLVNCAVFWSVSMTAILAGPFEPSPFGKFIGVQFGECTPDRIEATMLVTEKLLQPMGLLHGGATAAMAEEMGSVATFLNAPGTKANRLKGI